MRKLPLFLMAVVLALPVRAQNLNTERQIFQSNTAAIQSGGMANTLLAMSVASIGAVLTETCVPQPGVIPGVPVVFPLSVIIFSNASRAYIAAEVQAANLHNTDIVNRNAVVQDLARRTRIQGGGDAQQVTFVEAKKEREYLFAFADLREIMITPLITGYNEAAAQALAEADVPENRIVCTGTLAAALTVAQELGISFRASVGNEPAETILRSIGGVLEIVAAQILPLLESPSGRAVVAQIAAEATASISGELIAAKLGLETDIANIQTVIDSFESELGVAPGSGLAVPPNQVPPLPVNQSLTQVAAQSGTTAGTTQAAAAGALDAQAATGAAAGSKSKKCGEKKGKTFTFVEVCANPVQVSETSAARADSLTSKQVLTESAKLVNALFRGEMEVAKLAATNLRGLATAVTAQKNRAAGNLNLKRIQNGGKQPELEKATKEQIAKLTTEISKEVSRRGGEKLLASTSTATPAPLIKLPAAKPMSENLEDLPPRLRGKLVHQMRTAEAPTSIQPAKDKTPEEVPAAHPEEPTLWQRLTHRYQESYDRIFERKTPDPNP